MHATLATTDHPELGRLISTHRSRIKGGFFDYYLTLVLSFCTLSALAALGGLLLHGDFTTAAVMAPFAAVFGGLVFLKVAPWFQRVMTFEEGLVCRRLGAETVVRWGEVHAVYKRTTIDDDGRHDELVVERVRGADLEIHEALEGLERVRDVAVERTRGPILERTLTDLRAGRGCVFGAITVTASGLAFKGDRLSWFQIADATVRGGRFVVQAANPAPVEWAVPLDDLVNADILRQVLLTARAGRGEA